MSVRQTKDDGHRLIHGSEGAQPVNRTEIDELGNEVRQRLEKVKEALM
jgi:hypothetical protein